MHSGRNIIFLAAGAIMGVAILLIILVPSIIPSQTASSRGIDVRSIGEQLLILKKDLPDCFNDLSWNVTRCTVDKLNFDRFDFKNHSIVGHHLRRPDCVDPRQPKVEHPPKTERVGDVIFLLASKYFPLPEEQHYYCAYNVTIHFSDGGYIRSEFAFLDDCGRFRDDPSCGRRHTVLLTNPRVGRPVAGLAYDSQEQMLYFLVGK